MSATLIRGGCICDGSGAPAYTADLLIRGDRIADIGKHLSSSSHCRIVEAGGLIVAPGFIENNRYPMRLFYVWGHAYEFDNNDNWQDMEKFAAMIAGRDNIWYATNLEIYRYIQALRSVVSSTDGRLFYNPSAIPVYCFDANDQYVIAPGETLCLD